MKNKYFYVSLFVIISIFTSCDLLSSDSDSSTPTEDEIVQGLKKALELGTDSSSAVLSVVNGYYGDAAVKILLPSEAQVITDNMDNEIFQALGVSDMVDDVILGINRAAESAATKAKPIFASAISNLTVSDGLSILNGQVPSTTKSGDESSTFDSTAATTYLKQQTFTDLTTAFSEPINTALDEDISELGFSANDAWSTLVTAYNQGVSKYNIVAALTGSSTLATVDTDLGTYCTEKALDGLFYKVGLEEKKIRMNPYEWALDIITKVFGYVFK